MTAIFFWTGAAVWATLALLVLWLVMEIIIGLVTAISHLRWSYAGMRRHGRKPRWLRLPETLFMKWFEFIGYRNRGQCTYRSAEGDVWQGVNAWTLAPARPSKSDAAGPGMPAA